MDRFGLGSRFQPVAEAPDECRHRVTRHAHVAGDVVDRAASCDEVQRLALAGRQAGTRSCRLCGQRVRRGGTLELRDALHHRDMDGVAAKGNGRRRFHQVTIMSSTDPPHARIAFTTTSR
jgi:hypothetical protein